MRPQLLFFAILAILLSSCREYKKLLKSADLDKKYTEAVRFYEKGDCIRSLQLFDELMQVYKGTPKYESVYFYYAYSHYCVGDYILASYHFKTFARSYPTSKHAEECSFMAAQCYFFESPRYTLDQTDTRNAIKELQGFINRFPNSSRLDSCNKLIDRLRTKLEKKDMEICLQYYHMEDYKAAIASLNNLLKEYPDTRYRERVNYYIIKSTYEQALRSVDEKKIARLSEVIDLANKFQTAYRDSGEYRTEVNFMSLAATNLKERSAWDIPFSNFENRKYAVAIEGFREFMTLYPGSEKVPRAKEYVSDGYFLLVQLSFQNIEKSYGANQVIKAYKEYIRNAGKYTPLIDKKYAGQLESFRLQATTLAVNRSFDQLLESFKLQDLNSLSYFSSVENFFKESEKGIASDKERNELNTRWEQIRKRKETVDLEIGFWFFDAKNYERSRELLQRYFPVTEKHTHQSKAFHYFMQSLWITTEGVSVLRPDIRQVYYDSLYKLDKAFSHLLASSYSRKQKELMEEVRESETELPAEQVHLLFKNGQYDMVKTKGQEWLPKITDKKVRSRMMYYMARTGFLTSRYGHPSKKMLAQVQTSLKEAIALNATMTGMYKIKTSRMIRIMKRQERRIKKAIRE